MSLILIDSYLFYYLHIFYVQIDMLQVHNNVVEKWATLTQK